MPSDATLELVDKVAFLRKFGLLSVEFVAKAFLHREEIGATNWFELELGFALARGFSAAESREFARGMSFTFGDGEHVLESINEVDDRVFEAIFSGSAAAQAVVQVQSIHDAFGSQI